MEGLKSEKVNFWWRHFRVSYKLWKYVSDLTLGGVTNVMARANVFLLAWQVDIGMRHECTNCTQKHMKKIAMQLKLFAVQHF